MALDRTEPTGKYNKFTRMFHKTVKLIKNALYIFIFGFLDHLPIAFCNYYSTPVVGLSSHFLNILF